MTNKLIKADADRIDQFIFENFILNGIRDYTKLLKIDLKSALDVYHWRYAVLRKEHPEKFLLSENDYWNGFYS